jgi:replicative DNA helicase
MSIERIIFNNLVYNEEYGRKVIPFLKEEYFSDYSDKVVYGLIWDYVKEYNNFPSKEALAIELSNKEGVNQHTFENCKEIITSLEADKETKLEWLVDKTEQFCQEKAVYNAIMKSIEIIDNKDNKNSKGAIPQILSDALGVSFDTHIGHDLLDDADARFDFYRARETRIPFDLHYMNEITNGGVPKKTLNIIIAGTGVGKSLAMCHMAAANLMAGYNVLYITLEMAEERIAERIDANLLDITVDDLRIIPKETFTKKIEKLKQKVKGKLKIKEYPTATAGSANFRHLLNELKIKKNFVPDIIYIDYLNICISSRIKNGANVNSYTLVKAIAEELRGLAVEHDIPIFSATQANRAGYSNSDMGLENTSESFGLPATADFMFALISTEELEGMGQIMVKQLKNRYSDPGVNRRFVVGVDRSRMKLYDAEESAQKDILDGPVMDKSRFVERDEETFGKNKFNRDSFEGFK